MNAASAARPRVGSYELLAELACGGMATVSIARHIGAAGFERLVVVKRVHEYLLRDAAFSDMVRDEASVTAALRHPNVVSATDVVRDHGELLLVMEYFESVSLWDLFAHAAQTGARLPVGVAGRIVADVLAGLGAAHDAIDIRGQQLGIVHRDVSPQNVIVGVDGVSRVIDFGIAKAASNLAVTRTGTVKGKLSYMAPEQLETRPLDGRADLYSVAVMLFELLSGTRLFAGTDADVMRRVLLGVVPDLAEIAPNLPTGLVAVVKRGLDLDPAARFQTADAFLAALEETMPIAPARQVAVCVQERLGAVVDARRTQLRSVLGESELRHLSRRSGLPPIVDDPAVETTQPRDAVPRTLTVPATLAPRKPTVTEPTVSAPVDASAARRRPHGKTLRSEGNAVTAVEPSEPSLEVPGLRRRSLGVPVVVVLVVAVVVLGFAVSRGGPREAFPSPPPIVTASLPVPSVVPPLVVAAPPPPPPPSATGRAGPARPPAKGPRRTEPAPRSESPPKPADSLKENPYQ